MSFTVRITEDAEVDLLEIARYVGKNDSFERADMLIENVMTACNSLAAAPEIGHVPFELSRFSTRSHLQIHFKPYRIIYRIDGRTIWIVGILDGRRDLEDLLQRRLVR